MKTKSEAMRSEAIQAIVRGHVALRTLPPIQVELLDDGSGACYYGETLSVTVPYGMSQETKSQLLDKLDALLLQPLREVEDGRNQMTTATYHLYVQFVEAP